MLQVLANRHFCQIIVQVKHSRGKAWKGFCHGLGFIHLVCMQKGGGMQKGDLAKAHTWAQGEGVYTFKCNYMKSKISIVFLHAVFSFATFHFINEVVFMLHLCSK